MTSNDDSRDGKTPPGSNISGKRPHATLDLKAVEIKDRSGRKGRSTSSTTLAGSTPSATESKTTDAVDTASKQQAASSMSSSASSSSQTETKTTSTDGDTRTADTSSPPPQIVKRRGGFFGPLVGGILGGLLALFGGDYALQRLGVPKLAGAATRSMDAIEARLGDLEQQVISTDGNGTQSSAATTQTLDTITTELEKLKALSQTTAGLVDQQTKLSAQVDTLANQPAASGAAGGEEFTQRLSDLEQRIALVSAAAEADPNAGPIPQITALSEKITDLETALANQTATATPSGLTEDADARLKSAVAASSAATSETQRLDGEFAAVKSTANRLDQRVEALKSDADKLSESIKILNETTLKMSSEISTLRTTLQSELGAVARPADINAAVTPYKDRIANLENNLKTLEKMETQRATQAKSVVLSLELASLQRSVNSGKPFAEELGKVKAVAGDQDSLDALDKFAVQGVPTLATLQDNFRSLIHTMLQASKPEKDGSLLEQFMSQAKSVVRVRKVNHESDDNSVEAVIARMEESLKAGKLSTVIEQANALPDVNRAPAQSWLDQVAARTTVDSVMQGLQDNLKSSLSQPNLAPTP